MSSSDGPAHAREVASRGDDAELPTRIVHTLRLGHSRTQRVTAIVLAVLVLACLLGVVTRTSFVPLMPLPAFAVAGFGLYRMRGAGDERRLLYWSYLTLGAGLLGFWLMSIVGRAVGS